MTTGGTDLTDDIPAQLQDVDAQLAQLRGDASGLAAQVGGQSDGAQDSEDTAAALTNAEETQALIAALEARRETLQAKR